MSSQTYKNRIKEARAKRRRYIWKLESLAAMSCGGPIIVAVCAITVIWLAVSLAAQTPMLYWLLAVLGILSPFILVYVVLFGVSWMKSAQEQARSLAYVPTIDEQIAKLPAEDILLRGSEQPVATPNELLRAAREGSAAQDAESLLRSTDTGTT